MLLEVTQKQMKNRKFNDAGLMIIRYNFHKHFDLRDLEHSTIIYESPNKQPLLRVAWNKSNIYYLATIQQNCNDVMILDFRYPMKAVRTLKSHQA